MWLVTLLVLAAIAFVLVKVLTGKSSPQESSEPATQIEHKQPSTKTHVSTATSQIIQNTPLLQTDQ